VIVQVQDVIAFEANDNLAFARTTNGYFRLNVTLKELEGRLDSEGLRLNVKPLAGPAHILRQCNLSSPSAST
jgi:hypothetical protein